MWIAPPTIGTAYPVAAGARHWRGHGSPVVRDRYPSLPNAVGNHPVPAEVVVHTAGLDGTVWDGLTMLDAIYDVHNQSNEVGATAARVNGSLTNYSVSTEPFEFGQWYGDTTPTIHVGFAPSFANEDAGGQTLHGDVTAGLCTYHEAHIAMLDATSFDWDYGTPGDGYYRALGWSRTTYGSWFRRRICTSCSTASAWTTPATRTR